MGSPFLRRLTSYLHQSRLSAPHKLIWSAMLIAMVFPALSHAVIVNVDPGAYAGEWRIDGQTNYTTGPSAPDIPAGPHTVRVGNIGVISIDVAAGGVVTVNTPGAAIGGANALTFNSTTINVDPGNFLVQPVSPNVRWKISRVVGDQTAAASLDLVPGVSYTFIAGNFGGFEVTLDAAGNPSVDNGVSASVQGNTITFNTVPVTVDPGQFLNQQAGTPVAAWGVGRVIFRATTPATINLVPAARYNFSAGDFSGFFFQVDATGNVTVENGFSATGGYRTLTFNTTTINVDPGDFLNQADVGITANWRIVRVIDVTGTGSDVFVVPGSRLAVGVGFGRFFINIGQNGDVTVENGISATAVGSTMTFNTESITVDPGTYTGFWSISRVVLNTTGVQQTELVPGLQYRITGFLSPADFFDVSTPCGVAPDILNVGGETFTLSCGTPDSDGDGVPDDADICPGGDDNVDSDNDLVPDFCDSCPLDADNDADGDGTCGDVDVCPGADDSVDTDMDGTPDGDPNAMPPIVCDACPLDPFNDADNDGVCGDIDNCPLVANSNQANADGDQVGDACDADDDNDGVCDVGIDDIDCTAGPDNCPLDANSDQADFDNDGQGDVCDNDDDADGIVDGDDACPATPPGSVFDSNGCSIADLCPCDNDWKNHGAYVRCVAHAANNFVDIGLITGAEHGDIVSAAGNSDCGR